MKKKCNAICHGKKLKFYGEISSVLTLLPEVSHLNISRYLRILYNTKRTEKINYSHNNTLTQCV